MLNTLKDALKFLFKGFILYNVGRILSVVFPSLKNHPFFSKKISPKVATAMAKAESVMAKTSGARRILFIILSIMVMNAALFYIAIGTRVIWQQMKGIIIGRESKETLYEGISLQAELQGLKKAATGSDGKMNNGIDLNRIIKLKEMAVKLQEQKEQRETDQRRIRIKPLPTPGRAGNTRLEEMIAELEDFEKMFAQASDEKRTRATGLASKGALSAIESLVFGYDYMDGMMFGSQMFGALMIFIAFLLCMPAFGIISVLSTIVKAGRIRFAFLITSVWYALIVSVALLRFSASTIFSFFTRGCCCRGCLCDAYASL